MTTHLISKNSASEELISESELIELRKLMNNNSGALPSYSKADVEALKQAIRSFDWGVAHIKRDPDYSVLNQACTL